MVGAPFGVTHDHGAGAGIGQHLGRNISGMRAGGVGVAILPADCHPRPPGRRGKVRNQGCRRTYHQFGFACELCRAGYDLGELGPRGGKPVHFPVARNQRN